MIRIGRSARPRILEFRIQVGNRHHLRPVPVIGQDGMPAAIGSLVLVQTDGAASCADGTGPDNDVVDAIERQIATEQRRVELVRLEGDHGFYGFVLGSMNRIPAEIGADIDEDSAWRCGQVLGYPLGQQRLVGAVFGNVPADDVASIHEERQFRLLGAGAKRRTPGREPSQQKKQCSDRTDETESRAASPSSCERATRRAPQPRVCRNS